MKNKEFGEFWTNEKWKYFNINITDGGEKIVGKEKGSYFLALRHLFHTPIYLISRTCLHSHWPTLDFATHAGSPTVDRDW
jgi:hypothetical protein